MGLFSSLFGGSRKQDYSQLIPDPPAFSLAPGSLSGYTGGLQQLIDVFQNRASGNDQFDAVKYIYGPQETLLNQQYGINTTPGDIYASRTGALPQTLASMNQRGLLDTGTSGIVEAQLRSNLANQLASLFGQAKQTQRTDVDNSLNNLHQLFPEQFQAQNIQSQIDYDNAMNNYNTLLQRNQATVGQQQQRDANKSAAWQSGIGLGLAPFTGGASLGLAGGAATSQGGAGGIFGGGSTPMNFSFLKNLFGGQKSSAPGNTSSPLLNGGTDYINSYRQPLSIN